MKIKYGKGGWKETGNAIRKKRNSSVELRKNKLAIRKKKRIN
jgi:hypothetical protein